MQRIEALLREQHQRALTRLPDEVADYYGGGAGDEIALAEAEAAWWRYRLVPSVLRPVMTLSTTVELFGTSLPHPVLVAPTAFHGLAHPDGEVASAAGAAAAGSLFVLSSRSDRAIEDVAEVAGTWWFQVYVTRDPAVVDDRVRRAVDAGARALVLTGDTPFVGRKARQGRPLALDPALEQDPSIDENEIYRLAEFSGLPVLVKGVLRADDARRCLDAGASGLIVSNHGGRQLGRAVATADVLAEVVDGAGDAPVLVDGGVRTGTDVATALALGAKAVLVGKPVLWALAADGTDGVRDLLATVADDFAFTIALLGVTHPSELDRSYVRQPRS